MSTTTPSPASNPSPTPVNRTSGFDRSRAAWFRAAQPALWHLPPSGFRRFRTLVGRAITRRCPYCGNGHIYRNLVALKDTCPTCGIPFEREEGYFVGTYAVNLVAALVLGMVTVVSVLALTDLSVLQIQILGVAVAITLPILGYPLSAALWMAVDLVLDPPEKTAWEEVDRPDLVATMGTTGETAARLQREYPAQETSPPPAT